MLKRYRSPWSALAVMTAVFTAIVALTLLQASAVLAADAPATATPAATPAAKPAKPAKPAKVRAPEKSRAEQIAEDGLWAKNTNWLSVRAGYAKSQATGAGDGLVGYGLAYQHMINKRWAFGGSVNHDLLGHFGRSYEASVPFTLEFTRHYKWKTAVRPYVGFGGGYYFHKYYRTASDNTGAPGAGYFISLGTNLPLDDRHLLGLDTRVSFVDGRKGVINPVFGPEESSSTLWTVKLNWSLAY